MRFRVAVLLAASTVLVGCDDTTPAPAGDGARPTVVQSARADGRYVVGYFPQWGVYARNFGVKNVETSGNARRLTHLLYAFGKVTGGGCALGDPFADIEKPVAAGDSVDGIADESGQQLRGSFNQLRKLRALHPGLKIVWSFGGWNGSAGFTEAARDPDGFASSCTKLLDDPRWSGVFDGIDLDWEYPGACGLQCDSSGPDALSKLTAALRAQLGPDRLISAAVTADAAKIAKVDYARAAQSLDWIMPMTYDFAGTGDSPGPTAPHSPLTAYDGLSPKDATTEGTIGILRGLGIPARKLLLGIGFYGRGWTGVSQAEPGGGASGAAPGSYEKGVEDYSVLARSCPPTGKAGGTSYALCDGQWWSYDTPEDITAKMTYARDQALGGAFVWDLSGDTAEGTLLSAVRSGLG